MNRFRFRTDCSSTYSALPNVNDERATYTRWGWTWNSNQEPATIVDPFSGTYTINGSVVDIHDDTEGDDLWTYYQMYLRSNANLYLNRANAWKSYFQSGLYRSGSGGASGETHPDDRLGFGGDHTYGWGLLLDYEVNKTAASLAEAELLAAEIEHLWDPLNTEYAAVPNHGGLAYGLRLIGRHLNLIARTYEITLALRGSSGTNVARWLTLLNTIINMLLTSTYWNDTYGMYFPDQSQIDADWGAGEYNNHGLRAVSGFQIGIITEAMFNAWRVTGNTAIRSRLLRMADFVSVYGLDPTWGYTGLAFGVRDGAVVHYNSFINPTTPTWTPTYTVAHVNLLVLAYKFTGISSYLARAKTFFAHGTQGVYLTGTPASDTNTAVSHFIDTRFASATGYYDLFDNRGELQYTYFIFENGGLPTVYSQPSSTFLATLAASLSPGQWGELTGTNLTSMAMDFGSGFALQYADSAVWDPTSKQFMYFGGAHATGISPNKIHLVYSDTANAWQERTLPFFSNSPENQHSFCHSAIDAIAGHMYYRTETSGTTTPVYRYDIAAQNWGTVAYLSCPFSCGGVMGMTWHASLGTQGSLIIAGAGGVVYRWDKATNVWTDMTGPTYPCGNIANFAEYNPITNKAIFGGGSSPDSPKIYAISADGSIAARANAPFNLNIPYFMMSVDPVAGKFLAFRRDVNNIPRFYRSDTTGDSWSSSLSNPISDLFVAGNWTDGNDGICAAPCSTYGCTIYLVHRIFSTTKCYIYKGGL